MSLPHPATSADLAATAAAFARWRDTTPLGARIPEKLWSRAVELASTHGVARVATTLRLDYTRLKRRLTGQSEAAVPPPPAFVEMTLDLPPTGAGCILALSDARGRALRIEWTRPLASEVAVVARSLWEATV
ncbi:MAG: hypothetical protein WCD46_04080 [Desulfobacterales bacterium]